MRSCLLVSFQCVEAFSRGAFFCSPGSGLVIDSELVIVGAPLGHSVTDTVEGVTSNLRAGTAPLLTSFFLCHHVLVGNYVRACHQKMLTLSYFCHYGGLLIKSGCNLMMILGFVVSVVKNHNWFAGHPKGFFFVAEVMLCVSLV